MIYAGNQPYFIPYIGYWQLINAVDVFTISDDYNYIRHGWVNRNRILINGQPFMYTMGIEHASADAKINEIMLAKYTMKDKMRVLENAYAKAPHKYEGLKIMEDIFSCEDKNLANFLTNSIKLICEYLDIKTEIVRTSDYEHNNDYKAEYRIYDMCQRLGADTYYNAIGGQELYSYEEFEKRGLHLGFIKTDAIEYKQLRNQFVPNLSILDVIMFNDVDTIKEMLGKYSIITKNS